jgi:hypothetical protein
MWRNNMVYPGGTLLPNHFISKYASSGNLLNLYSDECILNNKGIEGMSISDFKEYDSMYGADFRNHMLLISCDLNQGTNYEFSEELINVFPKYKNQLR